ncbi:hypothetical protein ACJJTC_000739 [Scirpophaga incertulas]
MNSRNSVNESNLVNFSTDLSTLNQLDSKDGLLSFPFDHIYACSESSDRRQRLQLDKDVEISTHCMVASDNKLVVSTSSEINRLTEKLTSSENQNKRLKDLLIYHLDLIQQQNELISKREKLYQALKQENDTLKTKLTKRVPTIGQRHNIHPPPLVPPSGLPPPTPLVPPVTATVVKMEPRQPAQILLNSFTELVLPNNRSNSYLFDSDLNKKKPYGQDPFEIKRGSEDVTKYIGRSTSLAVPTILNSNIGREKYAMVENKRSYLKKEIKTEPRTEALYTVTSNSGNPIIHRIQKNKKRSSGIGSLSRMPKTANINQIQPTANSKPFEDDKDFTSTYTVNKKSKMINTYGKSRNTLSKKSLPFTGSLSDRLQLIDTTPTPGEDPYQLGEADMREQSPIPKLMLQKTNHGRMKVCSDGMSNSTTMSRRIYDPAVTDATTKTSTKLTKLKQDRYSLPTSYGCSNEMKKVPKTIIVQEPDLTMVKTEPEIDWRSYSANKTGTETSLCDFSYGENPNNLASHILPSLEFQDLFSSDTSLGLADMTADEYDPMVESRISNVMGSSLLEEDPMERAIIDSKRGRKRAFSATGLVKTMKVINPQKVLPMQKPRTNRSKAACRGKKSPLPGKVTNKPYHTLVGDPDLSWYLGLDPDVKFEDVDPTGGSNKASTVEVPRWREKPYTSCYTLEGTENLDDKIYEKRHQKLEAEERRQLRWHMRRIREQRHVEKLRQRHRDPWNTTSTYQQPSVFTIWPQPQRDVRFIEITDTLPVMAFGEILPAIPESDFMIPWVRTSRALKRAKRSKTLH